MHLLVDSTGLKLCGAGEWLAEKHGTRMRRAWKKLHIGLDADTGQMVAVTLTGNGIDDGSQVGHLLDQVAGPLTSFTGDSAYDRDDVSTSVTEHHPAAAIVVPPRPSAVPSETAGTTPPLPFQPLRGWNLEQLRPHSATITCSSSPSTAAWPGRRQATRRATEPRPASAGSSA